MTPELPSQGLAPLYNFFETYGTERLNGLNESYFENLSPEEKKEAWNFLENRFSLSADNIKGLFVLDRTKAVYLFKKTLEAPIASSPYPAQQKYFESNRLLMLKYVNDFEPSERYLDEICEFANSAYPEVRSQFAHSLPTEKLTKNAINALKGMIFTETGRAPLSAAISKLMAIHGLNSTIDSPLINSIYLGLRSDKKESKVKTMMQMENLQAPSYLDTDFS